MRKKANPYTILLDAALRRRLEKWCDRNEMLLSQAIRLAIKRMLNDKNFKTE